MSDIQLLERAGQPSLAYVYTPARDEGLPIVMFCGGYASDMQGSKATYLEAQCKARGQGYLRFDYSGHGRSGGDFVDGTIGAWFRDALAIFSHIVGADQRVVIVGSSMGGWIGLLLGAIRENQIVGYVGIAAAPDFTENLYHARLNDAQRGAVMDLGRVEIPNDYSDDPYIFTRALFEDGRDNMLLNTQHSLGFPLHLFQGMMDADVSPDMPKAIQAAYGDDVSVTYINDGDHRLSRAPDLVMIDTKIREISDL